MKHILEKKKGNVVEQQSGRSMIEMLGVLAIVGILSVGGIAGYSRAMLKLKINKTFEQVTHILTNIHTLYLSQGVTYDSEYDEYLDKYYGLDTATAIAIDVVPTEMKSSAGNTLQNIFGGNVIIDGDKYGELYGDTFHIVLTNIPAAACRELAIQNWPQEVMMVAASGLDTSYSITGDCVFGTELLEYPDDPVGNLIQGCRHDGGLPISVADAATACHCPDNTCSVFLGVF